jgi:tetratricopeptide (TPR) repeat protein
MGTAYDAGWEDAIILSAYAQFLLTVGDYEQALKFYVRRLNLAPVVGEPRAANLRSQAAALINLGRIEKAKRLLAEAWDLAGSVNPESYISHFANVGEKERAERILADLQHDTADKYFVATGYRDLGDVDNTFKAIEAAIEDHNIPMVESLRTAESWDEIRDDPRFDDMLKLLDSKETHTEQYRNDNGL